jgi:hypothetical protein
MPNNDEFKEKFSRMTNAPYIFMQPPCDMPESHGIIGAILEHRIDMLKGKMGKELPIKTFHNLWLHRETWMWPRTNTSNQSLPACEARYSPPTEYNAKLWKTFILGLSEDGTPARSEQRLPVFKEIAGKTAEEDAWNDVFLPRITRPTPLSALNFHNLSDGEKTWREILLGEGCGHWEQAIESKKREMLHRQA